MYRKSPISSFFFFFFFSYVLDIPKEKMAKLFANSGDTDQTLYSAASDLGLHSLPVTLLWVSKLKWVKTAVRYYSYVRLYQTNVCYGCTTVILVSAFACHLLLR